MNNEPVLMPPASSAADGDALGSAEQHASTPSLTLADALLNELALSSAPVPALRLTKRLRVRLSSLLRCVAYLGDGVISGNAGLGLVRLHQDGDRILLSLTEKGRDQWQQKKCQQKV